jgi:hypothetical protein
MTSHTPQQGDRESDHERSGAARDLDEARWQRTRAVSLLWIGVLLAPLAFIIDLTASFALVNTSCSRGSPLVTQIVTGVAALFASAALLVSIRNWRAVGADPEPRGEGVEHSDPRSTGHTIAAHFRTDAPSAPGRSRFMAMAGITLGTFFLVLVLASVIPTLVIPPCG